MIKGNQIFGENCYEHGHREVVILLNFLYVHITPVFVVISLW